MRQRRVDVKIAYWTLLLLAGFLAAGLAGFWLAVRPPRLTVSLLPRDYELSAEEGRRRLDRRTAGRVDRRGDLLDRDGVH